VSRLCGACEPRATSWVCVPPGSADSLPNTPDVGNLADVHVMCRIKRLTLVLVIAMLGPFTASAAGRVTLRHVGTFQEPVYVTAPPRDVDRVFVVERRGRIRVVVDGRIQRRPFLDITRRVSQPADIGDERGLLSMAFAPDYATSGRFYVYYTHPRRGRDDLNSVVLDEYRTSGEGATTADPQTRRQVLAIATGRQHFGGQLAFGPDGRLWLAPGDGRGPGDPGRQGQNRHTLRGKILRIDPRPGARLAPRGNPYHPPAGSRLVWASGLRNPFRFSFDRVGGDLVIGDVGQNFVEEIDVVTRAGGLGRGANFGWSRLEGRFAFNEARSTKLRVASRRRAPGGYVPPAIEHLHRRGWCAVTGGYVVRDPQLPQLYGRYVYGDFCRGVITAARITRSGRAVRVRSTGLRVNLLSSFGEDGCGRLYAVSLGGPVWRLADSGRCAGPAPLPFRVPASPRRIAAAEGPALTGAWALMWWMPVCGPPGRALVALLSCAGGRPTVAATRGAF